MDFLSKNLDWLEEKIKSVQDYESEDQEIIIIFDLPGKLLPSILKNLGQIELYMNNESVYKIIQFIDSKISTKSLIIQLFDSFFSKFLLLK